MEGRVVLLNEKNRRVAIKNRLGEYSVADVRKGALPSVGDLVAGDFREPGTIFAANLSKHELLGLDIKLAVDPVAHRARAFIGAT